MKLTKNRDSITIVQIGSNKITHKMKEVKQTNERTRKSAIVITALNRIKYKK
jgi:hypothetical protein